MRCGIYRAHVLPMLPRGCWLDSCHEGRDAVLDSPLFTNVDGQTGLAAQIWRSRLDLHINNITLSGVRHGRRTP